MYDIRSAKGGEGPSAGAAGLNGQPPEAPEHKGPFTSSAPNSELRGPSGETPVGKPLPRLQGEAFTDHYIITPRHGDMDVFL